jgi:phosphate:Na+ symporter
VTAVGAGLLTVPAALPLLASANAASVVNNLMRLPQEGMAGRLVFTLQAVQKIVGSLLLLLVLVGAALWPQAGAAFIAQLGHSASGQIALLFMLAQVAGALATSLVTRPVAGLLRRLLPLGAAQTLAQPAFLLGAALTDPPVALDLAMRELARLSARLPLLLDRVRAEPDGGSPPAAALSQAGTALAEAIKTYLTRLLDHHPRREEVAAALLLQAAAGNAGALHEALAELAAAAPDAATMPTSSRLIEALHALMCVVADHAETLGDDDPEFVLRLLGDRDELMEELRQRLTTAGEATPAVQDALFRMTILFERVVWLGRRLVVETSQAQRAFQAL